MKPILIAAFCLIFSWNWAQNLNEISQKVEPKLAEFPTNTQFAIAWVDGDKTEFQGFYKSETGMVSIENHQKVFEIGSVTKVFTSTVLADLVLENKIKLNDPIHPFFNFPFHDNLELKFQDLANHTSGLPRVPTNFNLFNILNPYQDYDRNKFETYLKEDLELTEIGKYAYSNLGAGLLGYTLGLVEGIDFQELLKKRVFEKYQMKNSFTSSAGLEGKLVQGLGAMGNPVPNWDFNVLFGGGGILSTVEDLSLFVRAHFDESNRELGLIQKPTFQVNETLEIGLAWHLLKMPENKTLLFHNGGTGGYFSVVLVDINAQKAVILLSNVSAFHPNNRLVEELAFELMNAP